MDERYAVDLEKIQKVTVMILAIPGLSSKKGIQSTSAARTNNYRPRMDYHEIIPIEPDKRSGKPCMRRTRMTVTDVLEYLAGGMTHQELLAGFPDLTEEDIRACLVFAADRERRLATLPHEVAVRPKRLFHSDRLSVCSSLSLRSLAQ